MSGQFGEPYSRCMTTTPSPLSGKTVVLIGGGTGIGLRVAQLAVDAGAQVVLGGRTASKLEAAAAQLGEAAHWFTVDTSDDDSVKAFFTNIPSVDALFTTLPITRSARSVNRASRKRRRRSPPSSGGSTASCTLRSTS